MMFTTSPALVSTNAPEHTEYDTYFVTPSDSVDLPTASGNGRQCRGLQITGSGNVNVNLSGGGTAVLTTMAAGQRILISITRILATSTTATGIVALY